MFGHMVVMNSIVERNYRSIGKPRCSLSGLPTSTALTREDMIGVYRDTSKDCQGDKDNFCRIILAGGTSHNDNSPLHTFVLLLLYCELHFLYSALIDIGEDEGIAQGFALFHRLLDVGHLAFCKYVLEEDCRTIARHKAYLIGKR